MSPSAEVGQYRLFFALWPDAGLREQIEQRTRLVARGSGGRIEPTRNLHLTLLFIGNVGQAGLELASSAAAAIASPAFELRLDRIQTPGRARVLWLGSSQLPPALMSLVRALRLSDVAANETQLAFRAHVTLVRNPVRSMPDLDIEPVMWPAREFVLVQSQACTTGSEYTVIGRWPLLQ